MTEGRFAVQWFHPNLVRVLAVSGIPQKLSVAGVTTIRNEALKWKVRDDAEDIAQQLGGPARVVELWEEASETLKPCPFCGCTGPGLIQSETTSKWYTWCPTCQAEGGCNSDKAVAIAHWNRRPQAQEAPQQPAEVDNQTEGTWAN